MTRARGPAALDQPPAPSAGAARGDNGLGPSLRRAWVGYQQQLDAELAAAGFADRGFPDGRVLRMCSPSRETTTAQIARELGITRQGANKIIAKLVESGYVTLAPSRTDRREKMVRPTRRAVDYLAAHRTAARKIERRLRREVGEDSFAALDRLLESLGQGDLRLREYLRRTSHE